MQEFDLLFKNFYFWLAGQYSHQSGGFYYAASSRNLERFKPDIESTAQALDILDRSDLIINMPKSMKKKLVRFFLLREDERGYFIDPQNEMQRVDRMVARALGFSLRSLRMLGFEPLVPPPGSEDQALLPSHLHSLDNFIPWLDARPWKEDAWMASDNISSTGIYFSCMKAEIKNELLDYLWDYLERKQNPETGVWGEGRPYLRLSGAFKLALFYNRFKKSMPRGETIFRFILNCIRTDISEDMCWTRNVMDLLRVLRPDLPERGRKEKEEIVEITYSNLARYLKPDGGFSRHVNQSLKMPNNVELGQGLAEGDMNAGTQALRIRSLCLDFLDLPDKPMKDYTKNFYEICQIH